MPLPIQELRKRFFHPSLPTEKTSVQHVAVNDMIYDLAAELNEILPDGRNKSIVFTLLEDVRMRSNASIAQDTPER